MSAEAEQSSSFGSRIDPFLGRPAFHAGVDFREHSGAPVFATGRSTGPHLHYEVRIDDDPVDPARFVRAGERLAGMSPPRN